MKTRLPLIVLLVFILLISWGISLPVATSYAQGFVTATPNPDGRILYIVQEGDTCSLVALRHGIGVQQLRQFNTRLDENCTIVPGQQLVVGLAVSNAPTGPAPT